MPNYSENKCSQCKKYVSPELLVIKRAVFASRLNPRKIIKTRTQAWKCPDCLKVDPDWMRDQYDSPAHTSPALERVREARRDGK